MLLETKKSTHNAYDMSNLFGHSKIASAPSDLA